MDGPTRSEIRAKMKELSRNNKYRSTIQEVAKDSGHPWQKQFPITHIGKLREKKTYLPANLPSVMYRHMYNMCI